MEQHGLGVVLGVVGGEDPVPLPLCQAVEEGVPHLAAALLQAQALFPGQGPHVLPEHGEAHPQLLGEGLGRRLVPFRFLPPEQVVHMGQHQPLPGELPREPVGQGHGVRPAGKAHHRQAFRGQPGQVGGGKILTHRESPRGK